MMSPGGTKFTTKDPEVGTLPHTSAMEQSSSVEKSLGSLFHGMMDVQSTVPKFKGSSTSQRHKTVHTQVLTGDIKLSEGAVDPSILGSVFFNAGKPQVASASFTGPITLEDIYKKFIARRARKPGS